MNDELIVRLISAVMANVTVADSPDAKLKINLTVAREMIDKLLIEYEIRKINDGR